MCTLFRASLLLSNVAFRTKLRAKRLLQGGNNWQPANDRADTTTSKHRFWRFQHKGLARKRAKQIGPTRGRPSVPSECYNQLRWITRMSPPYVPVSNPETTKTDDDVMYLDSGEEGAPNTCNDFTFVEEMERPQRVSVSKVLSQSTLTLLSTCSRRSGHSYVDLRCCFDESSKHTGFIQRTCIDKHRAQVKTNKMESRLRVTAYAHCKTANNFQRRVHYRIQADTTLNHHATRLI